MFAQCTRIQIIYLLLAAIAVSGLVSPPIALGVGLIFALAWGNPFKEKSHAASKILLQYSVVGLGFGMSFASVIAAGKTGIGFTAATIFGTLLVGWGIGYWLNVESNTSLLISSGTSICGGSAIAAVGSVIRADAKAMSVSLITIFVLNAAALFVFPVIGNHFHLSQQQFGVWAAIAIHDTSSVVGAASRYGEEALKIATLVKLTRALWIIPLTIGLAMLRKEKNAKIKIPWFILFFLLATIVTTLFPQGEPLYLAIKTLAKHGLTLTLFLIGSGLARDDLRAVGMRPMLQGILLWLIISVVSLWSVTRIVQ